MAFTVLFALAVFQQVVYKALPEEVPGAVADAMTGANPVNGPEGAPADRFRYDSAVSLIMHSVMLSALSVLAVARDLGKKKSYALAAVVILSAVVMTVTMTIQGGIPVLTRNITALEFVLALIYGIMIHAKYKDKEARRTV